MSVEAALSTVWGRDRTRLQVENSHSRDGINRPHQRFTSVPIPFWLLRHWRTALSTTAVETFLVSPDHSLLTSIPDTAVTMLSKLAPLGMLALGVVASSEFTPVDMLTTPRPQVPVVAPSGGSAISVVDQWEEKSNTYV